MHDDTQGYLSSPKPALPPRSSGLDLSAMAGAVILTGWTLLDGLIQSYEKLTAHASADLLPGPTFDYPIEVR